MEDIFEKYKQEICQMCKATKCNNNITVLNDRTKTIKCEEYIKDEEKIKIPEKHLYITAKQDKKVLERRKYEKLYSKSII